LVVLYTLNKYSVPGLRLVSDKPAAPSGATPKEPVKSVGHVFDGNASIKKLAGDKLAPAEDGIDTTTFRILDRV
jgi:hypothetical protein